MTKVEAFSYFLKNINLFRQELIQVYSVCAVVVSGSSKFYVIVYRLICLSTFEYIIPLVWLAILTKETSHAVRKSERPEGDSKQKVMLER